MWAVIVRKSIWWRQWTVATYVYLVRIARRVVLCTLWDRLFEGESKNSYPYPKILSPWAHLEFDETRKMCSKFNRTLDHLKEC